MKKEAVLHFLWYNKTLIQQKNGIVENLWTETLWPVVCLTKFLGIVLIFKHLTVLNWLFMGMPWKKFIGCFFLNSHRQHFIMLVIKTKNMTTSHIFRMKVKHMMNFFYIPENIVNFALSRKGDGSYYMLSSLEKDQLILIGFQLFLPYLLYSDIQQLVIGLLIFLTQGQDLYAQLSPHLSSFLLWK